MAGAAIGALLVACEGGSDSGADAPQTTAAGSPLPDRAAADRIPVEVVRGARPIDESSRVRRIDPNHLMSQVPLPGWVILPAGGHLASDVAGDAPGVSTSGGGNPGFVGPNACGECHPDKLSTFLETAHASTSSLATLENIRGSFAAGETRVDTRHPNLHYELEAREDGLYQTVNVERAGTRYSHSERFDIVTGSGRHGQSYLYWNGDALLQLPVSYMSRLDEWTNSPGYPDGMAVFARPIGGRCLECHSTYFETVEDAPNNYRYEQAGSILAVTCERCHGPGRDHVEFHQGRPDALEPRHIVNPGELPRDRMNDVCGQCHAGSGRALHPPFSFRPGEPLTDFYEMDDQGQSARRGVHSNNQLPRLAASPCFQGSASMSCVTCHDPHEQEHGNTALFSQRCLACHETQECALEPRFGDRLDGSCVECHMAQADDNPTAVQRAGGSVSPLLRDHLIQARIDGDQVERMIELLERAGE